MIIYPTHSGLTPPQWRSRNGTYPPPETANKQICMKYWFITHQEGNKEQWCPEKQTSEVSPTVVPAYCLERLSGQWCRMGVWGKPRGLAGLRWGWKAGETKAASVHRTILEKKNAVQWEISRGFPLNIQLSPDQNMRKREFSGTEKRTIQQTRGNGVQHLQWARNSACSHQPDWKTSYP